MKQSLGTRSEWIWNCVISLLCGLGVVSTAIAQDEFDLDLFRPRLDVAVNRIPASELTDISDETYGVGSVSLNALLPIGGVRVKSDSWLLGYQLFAGLSVAQTSPDITFLADQRDVYSGNANLSAVMLSRTFDLYIVSLSAGFNEDEYLIDSPEPRFAGFALGTRRIGKGLFFEYGIAYSYRYGKGMLLPLLGLGGRLKISERWSFSGLLPFLLKASCQINDAWTLHFRLSANGDQYRIKNNGEFAGQPDEVFARTTAGLMAVNIDYAIGDQLLLSAEAGLLGARKFSVSDSNDAFISSGIAPSVYLTISVRFWFGKGGLLERFSSEIKQ